MNLLNRLVKFPEFKLAFFFISTDKNFCRYGVGLREYWFGVLHF